MEKGGTLMVSALFHYPPTPLVFVYPSFINRSITFCLKSPCTMISPSLAEPPTPHFTFKNFPSASKSPVVPRKPVTNVTALPPRFRYPKQCAAAASLSKRFFFLFVSCIILKIRVRRNMIPRRSFQSLLFIFHLFFMGSNHKLTAG